MQSLIVRTISYRPGISSPAKLLPAALSYGKFARICMDLNKNVRLIRPIRLNTPCPFHFAYFAKWMGGQLADVQGRINKNHFKHDYSAQRHLLCRASFSAASILRRARIFHIPKHKPPISRLTKTQSSGVDHFWRLPDHRRTIPRP